MKIIIIGASHAGITAALAIKNYQPENEVLLFEKTDSLAFIPSSINLIYKDYFSFGELEKGELFSQATLQEVGVQFYLETEVTQMDVEKKEVVAGEKNYSYDILILATGSQHFIPNPPYLEPELFKKIITYKTKEHLQAVFPRIRRAHKVTIIGGGLICFELASSLAMNPQQQIQIIERNSSPISRYFNAELLAGLKKYLPQNVQVYQNESFYYLTQNKEKITGVVLSDGSFLPTDEVVLAINPQPNSDLVQGLLTLNEDKTVKVDQYLMTSQKDVYAIGDLINSKLSNAYTDYYFPTISNAMREALVVAYNITHLNKIPCPTIQKTIATELFGKYLASTGLTINEALYNGYKVRIIDKYYPALAHYGSLKDQQLQLQVICRKDNDQLLGVQLFSDNRTTLELINQFSIMIKNGCSLKDLVTFDRYFAPSLSFLPQIFLDLFMEAK